jgi:hypothetical protein
MCECRDRACADRVNDELTRFGVGDANDRSWMRRYATCHTEVISRR